MQKMNERISISLDEGLLKLIDRERGDVPRSKFIESLIKMRINIFQALWIFDDEFDEISRRERWIEAHASQPIGKPLHKHSGYVTVDEEELRFYDDNLVNLFVIKREEVKDPVIGYDERFRRFRDSRGLIPPFHINWNGKEIYMFTRTTGKRIFYGNNESFINAVVSKMGLKIDEYSPDK